MASTSDRVFRIQRPDGSYRGAGMGGTGTKERHGHQVRVGPKAKVWDSAAKVKNHLKLNSDHRDSVDDIVRKAGAEGSEVVEYELVERRRTPVKEFLADG
jgi:hypothetical protein